MMEITSKSEWAKLYQVAGQFQEVRPWNWMANEDLFAVVNPQSSETGYCSILGNGGQEFGLATFLGDKGYARYLNLFSDEVQTDDFSEAVMTPSLTLLFSDRQDLQKQDVEAIRSLGLQFRGKNAWPLFRSQRPGYVPWFLERGEVVYLTSAIEQALVVAERVRMGTLDLYEGADQDLMLTRYFSGGNWKEDWRKPRLLRQSSAKDYQTMAIATRDAELLSLRNSAHDLVGNWELDVFILPIPIGPKPSRPYFPLCFLVVERQLGIVIGTQMSEPWITLLQQQSVILEILKDAGHLPRNVRVKSKKVRAMLEPLTRTLGINLKIGPIPLLEKFRASLSNHLSGR